MPMTEEGSQPNPGSAPMSAGQEPEGDLLLAKAAIQGARKVLLDQSMKFEPGSKQEKLLHKAVRTLTKIVGKDEDDAEEMSPALKRMYLSDLMGPQGSPPPKPAPPQPQPGAMPLGPGGQLGAMAPT